MDLQVLDEALDNFADEGGAVYKKEAENSEALQDVSKALGLVLPESVNTFFRVYDCIAYGPEETIAVDQLLEHYQAFRQLVRLASPPYLPIVEDGSGGYFAVACQLIGSKKDSEFGNVMYFPSYPPFDAEFRSATFLDFLLSRLEFWRVDL